MIYFLISSLNWQFKGPNGGDFVWVSGRGCRILISNPIVVYTSSDCGNSWSKTNIVGGVGRVGQTRGNVFSHLVYYNTSDYTNWVALNYPFNFNTHEIKNISDRASDTIFIAVDSSSVAKIYRTTDGGLSWQLVSTFNNVVSYVINFRGSHVYYVFYDNSSQSFKIAYSSNLGNNWTIKNPNNLSIQNAFDLDIDPSNHNHIIVVALVSSLSKLFRSTDGGSSFSDITDPSSSKIIASFDVEFYNSSTIYVSSHAEAGITKGQLIGSNWVYNRVFSEEASFSLSIDGSNMYAAILGQGFIFSNDAGNTWSIRNNGLVGHMTSFGYLIYPLYKSFISNSRSNKFMFINAGGNIFVNDNSNNLIHCANPFDFGNSVDFAPFSENIVLVSGVRITLPIFINIQNLKKSTSGCSGQYSNLYSPNFVSLSVPDSLVADIQINSDPNRVFMISNTRFSNNSYDRFLYYSNNGGSTRSVVGNSQISASCHSCIDTLFYVSRDSLFISYNGGQSWSLLIKDNFLNSAFVIEYYKPYVIVVGSANKYKYYNIANLNDSATVMVSQFSDIEDIGITSNGRIFIIGYNHNYDPTIGMVSLNGSTQHISNLPGSRFAIHVKVLNNYIWYYDGVGFWVADWTVGEKEWKKDITIEYTKNGILFKNYDGRIRIYDIQGRFLAETKGNFISYSMLKKGIYIVKTDKSTHKVLIK